MTVWYTWSFMCTNAKDQKKNTTHRHQNTMATTWHTWYYIRQKEKKIILARTRRRQQTNVDNMAYHDLTHPNAKKTKLRKTRRGQENDRTRTKTASATTTWNAQQTCIGLLIARQIHGKIATFNIPPVISVAQAQDHSTLTKFTKH